MQIQRMNQVREGFLRERKKTLFVFSTNFKQNT